MNENGKKEKRRKDSQGESRMTESRKRYRVDEKKKPKYLKCQKSDSLQIKVSDNLTKAS